MTDEILEGAMRPPVTEATDRVLRIPALSLVVLVGPSSSGKTTFARTHFAPFETISSDFCRGLVSNDENDQAATQDAFQLLHFLTAKRLARGLLTVIDATNVQREARRPLVELAHRYQTVPVAIVLDLPARICETRHEARPDRAFGVYVIRRHRTQLHESIDSLGVEGFQHVSRLRSEADIANIIIERQPLENDTAH